ncbi:MAG: PilZ domain-containing protein [Holophagaceae bacterium]|nr:PilZ domain-containing protein [Holophagaceae bacterium]
MANRNKKDEIREIFEGACAQQAPLIIATQYLKFESNLVHFEGNEVHAKTIAGGEDALSILKISNLDLRFPFRLDFIETSAKFVGIGTHAGSKTIKFSLPNSIEEKGGRHSTRLSDLGRAYATFKLAGQTLIRASMIDLSTTGTRLKSNVNLVVNKLQVNDRIMLSIYLPDEVAINNGAIIRHVDHRTFGLEFSPELSDSVVGKISKWAFMRQEKAKEQMSERVALSDQAARIATIAEKNKNDGGIVVITRDDEMDTTLQKLLGEGRQYYRIPPATVLMDYALSRKPQLIIFHVDNDHFAERLLMKSLAESIPMGVPILFLGTVIKAESLVELSQACGSVTSLQWMPSKSLFLQRLVLGIMRNFYGHAPSPTLPRED